MIDHNDIKIKKERCATPGVVRFSAQYLVPQTGKCIYVEFKRDTNEWKQSHIANMNMLNYCALKKTIQEAYDDYVEHMSAHDRLRFMASSNCDSADSGERASI